MSPQTAEMQATTMPSRQRRDANHESQTITLHLEPDISPDDFTSSQQHLLRLEAYMHFYKLELVYFGDF